MNKYIKPKNGFPEKISLHDCVITACKIHGNALFLEFGEGFYVLSSSESLEQNGTKVNFSDIDADFCCVRILGKKKYREYNIEKFPKLLKNKKMSHFEIVDQYFGYNSVMLSGVLWKKNKWKQFQLEIYHTGDMIYEYE